MSQEKEHPNQAQQENSNQAQENSNQAQKKEHPNQAQQENSNQAQKKEHPNQAQQENSNQAKKKIDQPVFATFIHSITHSALAAMGLIPEMKEKKNKVLAEFNIELLLLLRKKTKGNLTIEEQELMDNCIQDLQITFAQQTDEKG